MAEHEKAVVCPYESRFADFAETISEVKEQQATIIAKLDEIQKDTATYGKILNGNGRTGLILTVDRLVQSEKARQRTFYLAAGTAFTVLAKILWDVVAK